jgi:hypothetical protein
MNTSKIIGITVLALILLIPGAILTGTGTGTALATSSFDRTTVFVVDGTGAFVRDLNLKATEAANGDVIPVSSFEIEAEDVVQVKQNGNFLVFTGSEEDVVEKVKVTAQGVTTDLVNLGGNSWSIQGLATGVYTLDVIIDTGDESQAFETILVVLGVDQSPLNPLTIINNFENVVKTKTIIKFRDNDNDDDDDKDDGNKTKPPTPKPKPEPPNPCDVDNPPPECEEPVPEPPTECPDGRIVPAGEECPEEEEEEPEEPEEEIEEPEEEEEEESEAETNDESETTETEEETST